MAVPRTDGPILTPPSRPTVTWRESPRFARDLAPRPDRASRSLSVRLGVFAGSATLFLGGRFAWAVLDGARLPWLPTTPDLIGALVAGSIPAFGIPWMFRHSFGHVEVDDRMIQVVRMAAFPPWPSLHHQATGAEAADAFRAWDWGEVARLDTATLDLTGRRYDVLVVTTRAGLAHPIALDRRTDLPAVFRLAASAGVATP